MVCFIIVQRARQCRAEFHDKWRMMIREFCRERVVAMFEILIMPQSVTNAFMLSRPLSRMFTSTAFQTVIPSFPSCRWVAIFSRPVPNVGVSSHSPDRSVTFSITAFAKRICSWRDFSSLRISFLCLYRISFLWLYRNILWLAVGVGRLQCCLGPCCHRTAL